MKVLVTGATGFVGQHLIAELLIKKFSVKALLLPDEKDKWDKAVEIIHGDIQHIDTLYPAVRDIDLVFHLAAVKGVFNNKLYQDININGTKNLVDAIKKVNPNLRRLIFLSSQSATGPCSKNKMLTENDSCNPIDSYGRSKLESEKFLVNQTDLPFTILRISPIYGPGNNPLSGADILYRMTRHKIFLSISPGERYLQMIHIRDAINAIMMAGESEATSNDIYFITTNEICSWRNMGLKYLQAQNLNGIVLPVNVIVLRFVVLSIKSYRYFKGLSNQGLDEMADYFFQRYWLCSPKKAKKDFGFEAKISLDEGILDLVQWYKGRENHS